MSTIVISLAGQGRCRILHGESGAAISTSVAPEYGGAGDGFSSTDLLAAALGSCIASNLEPVATRHDVPLEALRVNVDKRLDTAPKRIESLAVTISVTCNPAPSVVTRLERAAHQCVVHRALSPEVEVTIRLDDS